jgi:hypothetical protein
MLLKLRKSSQDYGDSAFNLTPAAHPSRITQKTSHLNVVFVGLQDLLIGK